MGAAKMDAPARSRYTKAGALSVALIAWLAVAQYLGSANAYSATTETAVPTIVFGLLIPLIASAIGLWRSASIARLASAIPLHWIVAAQIYRVGGGIFLGTLGGRAPALAIRAARGDWGRDNRLYGRCCGCAVGAKVDRRSQSGLPLVPFWHRRPCRGDRDGRIDLSRPAAPPCPRRAEHSHHILSAGNDTHLRCPAGPDAPWPRSVAAAVGDRLERPTGRGVMPLAGSTVPGRAARCRLPHFRRPPNRQKLRQCGLLRNPTILRR